MQIGIVGLPFSGKSTLFQTITKTHFDHSVLARAEPHQAVVKVPDARLDRLSELFTPKKTIHASIEFVDVIGLKKGETGSTQFTTNFLSSVKNNDALIQVVRVFADDAAPHPDGSVDPLRDVASFETEFIISDLSILETRIDRLKKQIQKTNEDQHKRELPLLERCCQTLEKEIPLREAEFMKEELHVLKTYQLLTFKPMLIALNFDETQLKTAVSIAENVSKAKTGKRTKVMSFFGKIEMEMSELPDDEAKAFMDDYGIAESALSALIRESYALLGLHSFFTVGEDECRAWTIKKGMNAQEAAGAIHSDFVSKFIRAEVVHYEPFIAHDGSFAKAKEAGVWRLEGKEFIVTDGDIISIRHS